MLRLDARDLAGKCVLLRIADLLRDKLAAHLVQLHDPIAGELGLRHAELSKLTLHDADIPHQQAHQGRVSHELLLRRGCFGPDRFFFEVLEAGRIERESYALRSAAPDGLSAQATAKRVEHDREALRLED